MTRVRSVGATESDMMDTVGETKRRVDSRRPQHEWKKLEHANTAAESLADRKCEKMCAREFVREMDMSTPVMQEMSSAKLDVAWVREQFPSLKEQVAGAPAAFLDGRRGRKCRGR